MRAVDGEHAREPTRAVTREVKREVEERKRERELGKRTQKRDTDSVPQATARPSCAHLYLYPAGSAVLLPIDEPGRS